MFILCGNICILMVVSVALCFGLKDINHWTKTYIPTPRESIGYALETY